jgi:hypothetical protein
MSKKEKTKDFIDKYFYKNKPLMAVVPRLAKNLLKPYEWEVSSSANASKHSSLRHIYHHIQHHKPIKITKASVFRQKPLFISQKNQLFFFLSV